jgi:hypothetical protein
VKKVLVLALSVMCALRQVFKDRGWYIILPSYFKCKLGDADNTEIVLKHELRVIPSSTYKEKLHVFWSKI